MDALAPGFLAKDLAVPACHVNAPGCGQCCRRGQGNGVVAFVEVLTPDACRTIGQDDPAQADVGKGMGGPDVRAGEQLDLLFEAESGSKLADPRFGIVGADGEGFHQAGLIHGDSFVHGLFRTFTKGNARNLV